jgi:hypothetical protein
VKAARVVSTVPVPAGAMVAKSKLVMSILRLPVCSDFSKEV